MLPAVRMNVTANMTSHSLRRGATAYANASPKLAIQWISTRGVWLLKSLTKAFAYIGTTTKEDYSVAKVLAGYQAPDLPVSTPSIRDLQQCLSVVEFGQSITLRDELYRHALGFEDARFNVDGEVIDATFASLLMHMETVLEATGRSGAEIQVPRYRYELERGIASTNARLGCSVTVRTCFEWGAHLRTHWQAVNHAQVGHAVAGGNSVLQQPSNRPHRYLRRQLRLQDPFSVGTPIISALEECAVDTCTVHGRCCKRAPAFLRQEESYSQVSIAEETLAASAQFAS